jgi:hypothetical protein
VQRVVPELGVERHLDIVVFAAVVREDTPDFMAEVAFHFQDEAASPPLGITGTECKDLVGEGVHAAGRFAGADGAEDGDAGKEATLGNSEPSRVFGWHRLSRMVELTDYKEKITTLQWLRIGRERTHGMAPFLADKEDVQEGEAHGAANKRCCEQHREIEVLDGGKDEGLVQEDQLQNSILFGEWETPLK